MRDGKVDLRMLSSWCGVSQGMPAPECLVEKPGGGQELVRSGCAAMLQQLRTSLEKVAPSSESFRD